jgi:predicted signal transduction protein with EAL and GGDEF domain
MSRRLKDLAGRDGVAARLGGDEFALSVRVPAPSEAWDDDLDAELENALAHTREALNRAMVIDGFVCRVGATLGAAVMGEDGHGFDTLMRRADLALYDAKRRRRGSAARYRQHMEDMTLAKAEMEMDLRAAVEREEIEPHYMALSDLNDGRIIGYEVLARWRHETRGDIPPAEFIPIAEDAGVITPMMESLLRQACSEVLGWEGAPNLAVNISPVQFRDPWLAGRILGILSETGFPAARLEVELTESVLTSDLAVARDVVLSLKKEGVRIVLDDFGTGYSSLKYLREMPFDRLKIDRSFVQTYRDNPDSRSMVAAIFLLARGLAIGVTAEGIEDAECEAILKNLGCDYGQGYLYGKPRRQPAQVQLQFDMETAAEPARLSR